MNNDLEQRYRAVRGRIAEAAHSLQATPPLLLAVSKKHSSAAIRTLYMLGQRDFGESYWQEAETKMQALEDLDLVWHFIGPIQSNKTRPIAEHFHWVHSVEREKIARRLSEQRPDHLPPLNLCLQVNIDQEASKSGVLPEAVLPLAQAIQGLPKIRLRGLMCIPRRREDPVQRRASFHHLAELGRALARAGMPIDTLSMGMSDDLEAAIAEGSTILRIGTALFGERQKTVTNPS
ncbi:YggS family pyridoxal phosphate-dependent enzyme [Ketobacter sp.]|uniref:YggS family pyridoxal phosphate-dependent enzyme n=1 Tax=Ketobacter sp. TaxID=2083498 RepID=UPI000F1209DC|nr:YggS family pyridoxal phosphate-dependent enzyme [Ketobacter sp.]RLT95122.1 MAG: YggS family pyridoxal phosphate-dependent enzyme [Ketobacter sp.]